MVPPAAKHPGSSATPGRPRARPSSLHARQTPRTRTLRRQFAVRARRRLRPFLAGKMDWSSVLPLAPPVLPAPISRRYEHITVVYRLLVQRQDVSVSKMTVWTELGEPLDHRIGASAQPRINSGEIARVLHIDPLLSAPQPSHALGQNRTDRKAPTEPVAPLCSTAHRRGGHGPSPAAAETGPDRASLLMVTLERPSQFTRASASRSTRSSPRRPVRLQSECCVHNRFHRASTGPDGHHGGARATAKTPIRKGDSVSTPSRIRTGDLLRERQAS